MIWTRGWAPRASCLLLVQALSACARSEPPSVTPEVARVQRVSGDGVDLQVTLAVHNPNSFALDAREVEGSLVLEGGHKLGTGRAEPHQSIPAHGTASVNSQVHITWAELPSLQKFLSRESVPYNFQGKVTLGGEMLHFTLPFELKGSLTREQLLSAGLRGLLPR